MIKSILHIGEVSELLKSYGLEDVAVRVVKDLPLGNRPFLPACTMPDLETNKQTIYLREVMDEDVIIAGKQLIPKRIVSTLTSEKLFLIHTILHEIAHIIFRHRPTNYESRIDNEQVADFWAFHEMKKMGLITD